MRLREFAEDIDGMVEDEAEARGDGNLLTTLDFLRSQSEGKHLVPRIKATALISLVNRQSDGIPFTLKSLMDAYKTNAAVKNIVSDIKDDDDGEKYVYLAVQDNSNLPADSEGSADAESGNEKIVSQMANKAAANRS